MDFMIQIAFGVIPAFLLLLIVMLITRRQFVPKLIAMALLLCVGVGAVVGHFTTQNEDAGGASVDQTDSMDLVYALVATGDSQQAGELLDEIMSSSVYSSELSLCKARLYALQGNYVPAKGLYEKVMAEGLSNDEIRAELDLVSRCVSGMNIDQALLEHDSSFGASIPDVETLLANTEQAKKDLQTTLEQTVTEYADDLTKALIEGAAGICQVDDLYDSYIADETVDEEQVATVLKKLTAMERKHPGVFTQSVARLAKMKLRLIQGNYKGIAGDVDKNADYKELMVVSELYLNDYISKKDFAQEFAADTVEKYEIVLKQLEQVYNTEFVEESASVRKQVKDYMDDMRYCAENPGIAHVQEMLESYAKSSHATDGSKVYLQLSNLAHDRGSSSAADHYMTGAMNTVGDCTDKNYTDPMYQIIDVINSKDNTEGLKNINQYVDQVLDNSTTMQLHSAVLVPAEKEEEPDAEQAQKVGFDTYVSDYVSQKRTSINIIELNTENFSEIVMDVSVDSDIAMSAERLKALLNIVDCGAQITDFTVEDISYDRTNIILVCDVSGSMDGSPIADLRSAVSLFVSDKTDKEHIGLVTFSSGVEDVYGLDSTVEQLNAAASSLYAGGGTNMYDAVIHAISMLEAEDDAMNIIILMSDGNDGYPRSESTINENICKPCMNNGIVLYSIGLGSSVDSNYLDTFAAGTGGSYLYVSDSQTLATFYEYLHSLIANRYRITFKALDTFTNDRNVRVEIKDDELAYDERHYTLGGETEQKEQEVLEDKYLYGLDTRLLYKSDKAQTVNLKCSGFTADDKVTVTFKADLKYSVTCKFVSESCYELTIPSNIAVGEYDMTVTVGDYTAYFAKELIIGAEDFITTYGPYTFTSCVKKESGSTVELSGYVCLNSWLHFNGKVSLTGDLENDASINMHDGSGSYIQYSTSNAQGIAKFLAQKNKTVGVPALGNLRLYNDTYHAATSSDYKVDTVALPVVYISNVFTLGTPGVSLYPNSIKYDINAFDTKFPFQSDILKESGMTKLFSFEWDGEVYLTNMTIGLNAEFSSEHDSKNYSTVNLGSMPIHLNPAEFEIKINTVENEYFIKYMTRVMFLPVDGLGFSLKWSGNLVPEEVRLYCDADLNTNFSGVPVTFSDFELAISDIDTTKSVLYWMLEGKTKISVAKVSGVLPKLEKYIGDVEFCSLDNTTLKFSFGQRYISASTELKLFEDIKVGSLLIECGKFSYTNYLLDMDDVSTSGLRVVVSRDLDWSNKDKNCNINMTGEVELTITDQYIGGMITGECDIEVKWWVFKKGVDIHGSGLIGVYKDRSGDVVFTVRARGTDGNKNRGINITWSKRHGKDVNTKYY
jgi:Mg-chelatase subunit ChlD